MSPIGRIFLVLNLILSAVFLGWASNTLSTSTEWKEKHDEMQAEKNAAVEGLEQEIAELNAQLAQAQSQRATYREERDQFQARAERAEAELAEAKSANARLRETVEVNTQKLDDYNARLEDLMASKDRAVEEARQMEQARDEARTAAREAERAQRNAEEALASAQQEIADLEVKLTAARSEISRLDATLQQIMANTDLSLNDFEAVPEINATVLGVDEDLGLVALNVGRTHGVRRGMTFSVWRGTELKGKVRVENVDEHQSSAVITRRMGPRFDQGDQASTQL